MAKLYKQYLKLFESWPIDITKQGGRDYGEYLRFLAKEQFGSDKKLSPDEESTCLKHLASLNRLSSDQYKNKFPRSLTSSATGLSAEDCNAILSKEFLEHLEKESKKGTVTKIFNMLKSQKSKITANIQDIEGTFVNYR